MKHHVYELVASTTDGPETVYVGVTSDPRRRFSQHRREKWWWRSVFMARVHETSTRSLAEEWEADLISELEPRFNVRLNPGRFFEPPSARLVETVCDPRGRVA